MTSSTSYAPIRGEHQRAILLDEEKRQEERPKDLDLFQPQRRFHILRIGTSGSLNGKMTRQPGGCRKRLQQRSSRQRGTGHGSLRAMPPAAIKIQVPDGGSRRWAAMATSASGDSDPVDEGRYAQSPTWSGPYDAAIGQVRCRRPASDSRVRRSRRRAGRPRARFPPTTATGAREEKKETTIHARSLLVDTTRDADLVRACQRPSLHEGVTRPRCRRARSVGG